MTELKPNNTNQFEDADPDAGKTHEQLLAEELAAYDAQEEANKQEARKRQNNRNGSGNVLISLVDLAKKYPVRVAVGAVAVLLAGGAALGLESVSHAPKGKAGTSHVGQPHATNTALPSATPTSVPGPVKPPAPEQIPASLAPDRKLTTAQFKQLPRQKQLDFAEWLEKGGDGFSLQEFEQIYFGVSKESQDAPRVASPNDTAEQIAEVEAQQRRFVFSLTGQDRADYMAATSVIADKDLDARSAAHPGVLDPRIMGAVESIPVVPATGDMTLYTDANGQYRISEATITNSDGTTYTEQTKDYLGKSSDGTDFWYQ